jgi:hypothetical protein
LWPGRRCHGANSLWRAIGTIITVAVLEVAGAVAYIVVRAVRPETTRLGGAVRAGSHRPRRGPTTAGDRGKGAPSRCGSLRRGPLRRGPLSRSTKAKGTLSTRFSSVLRWVGRFDGPSLGFGFPLGSTGATATTAGAICAGLLAQQSSMAPRSGSSSSTTPPLVTQSTRRNGALTGNHPDRERA